MMAYYHKPSAPYLIGVNLLLYQAGMFLGPALRAVAARARLLQWLAADRGLPDSAIRTRPLFGEESIVPHTHQAFRQEYIFI